MEEVRLVHARVSEVVGSLRLLLASAARLVGPKQERNPRAPRDVGGEEGGRGGRSSKAGVGVRHTIFPIFFQGKRDDDGDAREVGEERRRKGTS